jgi:hypothetical protein
MKQVKKILLWFLVAFFLYALVTQPDKAAAIIQNIWDLIVQAFQAIGSFFNSILNHN